MGTLQGYSAQSLRADHHRAGTDPGHTRAVPGVGGPTTLLSKGECLLLLAPRETPAHGGRRSLVSPRVEFKPLKVQLPPDMGGSFKSRRT